MKPSFLSSASRVPLKKVCEALKFNLVMFLAWVVGEDGGRWGLSGFNFMLFVLILGNNLSPFYRESFQFEDTI